MYIFVFILILSSVVIGQTIEDGWLGVLPIQNNRVDIEKKFGTPKNHSGNNYIYETENAVVSFWFSGEPCSGEEFGKWNVPKGTILNYSVGLKTQLLINDLMLNKNKFSRNNETEKGEDALYYNNEANISVNAIIEENNKEIIMSMFFYPAKKYRHLKCS